MVLIKIDCKARQLFRWKRVDKRDILSFVNGRPRENCFHVILPRRQRAYNMSTYCVYYCKYMSTKYIVHRYRRRSWPESQYNILWIICMIYFRIVNRYFYALTTVVPTYELTETKIELNTAAYNRIIKANKQTVLTCK